MQKYRLTITVEFDAIDDMDARLSNNGVWLTFEDKQNDPEISKRVVKLMLNSKRDRKLQKIFENKSPVKVYLS